MSLETIHIIVSLGVLIVTVILTFVGLKIKLEVSEGRNEILQTTSAIAAKLDTHVQLDDVKHVAIDRHLEYTDKRVDRIERTR